MKLPSSLGKHLKVSTLYTPHLLCYVIKTTKNNKHDKKVLKYLFPIFINKKLTKKTNEISFRLNYYRLSKIVKKFPGCRFHNPYLPNSICLIETQVPWWLVQSCSEYCSELSGINSGHFKIFRGHIGKRSMHVVID